MALAAAPPQALHAAAETETRVHILGKATMYIHRKPFGHPCSVRLYGELSVSHGSRRAIGVRPLDHRVKVPDFTRVNVCSQLINDLIDEAQESSEYETYDLAAKNWVDSSLKPRDMAEAIARYVREEFDDDMGVPVPGLEFEIHLPELRVTLIYRCTVCWLDSNTQGQGIVTLPCSHVFHTRCVAPWFHGASTCPTCRLEIVDPFSFVRSATPEEEFMDIGAEDEVLLEEESEDNLVFDGKPEDDELFDDDPEDELFVHLGAEDAEDAEDDLLFDDKSEDEELFDDESEDELFMHIGAEDIEDESEDDVLFDEQSEDDEMFDDGSEDEPFVDIMT